MTNKLYYILSNFYPRSYTRKFNKILIYAGDNLGLRHWLGLGMLVALLVFFMFLLLSLIIFHNFNLWVIFYGFLGFFFIHLLVYLLVYFKVEDRKEHVEKVLPDFLQLMAANVNVGMTPYQAMRLSLRDEFGPLKEELQYALTKGLGTENFSQVLLQIKERVPSEIFHRTLELLTSSLRSGGKLSLLLEDLAKDVIETKALKKELVSSTKTYGMFVLFTVLIGAPLLLAISTYFLTVMTGLQGTTGVVGSSSLVGEISITPEFFRTIGYIFLIFTSVLASVLVGVIKTGEYLYGLRYAPFVAAGSVFLFFILQYLVVGFLG